MERMGLSGQHYWELARGIDRRQVKTHEERKSIGREITFSDDINDMLILQQTINAFSAELCRKLRQERLLCSTVTLKLRYNSFKTISRSRTIAPSHADVVIDETAQELLRMSYSGDPPLRLIGLSLGKLAAVPDWEQGDLFTEAGKYEKLDMLMDQIRQRFGSQVIHRGNQIYRRDDG